VKCQSNLKRQAPLDVDSHVEAPRLIEWARLVSFYVLYDSREGATILGYLELFLYFLLVSITLIVLSLQPSKTVRGNRNLSKAFLILGCGALVASLGIGIYIFRGARSQGYIDSAIISIRAVAASEARFAEAHPELGYTCELSALPRDELIAGLVDYQRKNGYLLEITGCRGEGGKGPNSKYQVTVRSLHSGMPAFCSDQSGMLKYDSGGSTQRCVQSGTPF
jgi:hypothetical protein